MSDFLRQTLNRGKEFAQQAAESIGSAAGSAAARAADKLSDVNDGLLLSRLEEISASKFGGNLTITRAVSTTFLPANNGVVWTINFGSNTPSNTGDTFRQAAERLLSITE